MCVEFRVIGSGLLFRPCERVVPAHWESSVLWGVVDVRFLERPQIKNRQLARVPASFKCGLGLVRIKSSRDVQVKLITIKPASDVSIGAINYFSRIDLDEILQDLRGGVGVNFTFRNAGRSIGIVVERAHHDAGLGLIGREDV